ncbi:LPS-assembly protein LptD [Novosphingobium sp. Gsoil 351]|uniref:LPS-assembly protein LptD n=1 Tax=Novosphingobium sp. Gsoil 351 TaxID=2675225 RepID=UPI0012B48E5F|nr:LPS assembly protein LptD [Novosphingobium sp. Gsoil 351]QGN53696.1 LPS assembly protein LptD [Novosphingobium sp. Gsoil 351]
MQRSPRSAPQAQISSLRGLAVGLALACALPALAWPSLAVAQDGSAAVDKEKAESDPLGARKSESFPAPALSQPASPTATAPDEERINFEADRVEYGNDTQIVNATGNVVLVKGDQSVRADGVTWNRQSGQIVATGNVRAVDQDGNLLLTDRVELTDELKAGMIENLLLVMREGGRIAADKGLRDDAGRIVLTNAAYTACAVEDSKGCPKKPSWRINADRVVYDPAKQRVRYDHAKLEIFGVAVPLPFLAHSTNGSAGSGVLPPSLRFSRSNGAEIEGAYYLRLSESRDVTVSGHVYSEVLPMIAAQYRELTDIGAYQITGYATRSSRLPIDQSGATRRDDFRGAIDANGRFQFSPEWSLTTSTRLTTDRTFLRRYDISRDDRLRNTLQVERIDPGSYLSIAGWATQTLQVGVNQGQVPIALPAIDYRRRLTVPVIGGKVELMANSLGIIRGDGQDSQRAFAGARWDLRKITVAGIDATLTGLVRGDVYHSDENLRTATAAYRGTPGWQARGVALAAIDVKYPLVGGFLGGTQILTPRVQIVASPPIDNFDIPNEDSRAIELEDTNLFALNRFPGYDRVEDGNRITYGLDWLWERLEWRVSSTVGQSYRLTDKPTIFPNGTGLTSRTSDIVGRTQVRYREFVSLTHRFRLDKDGFAVRRNEFDATIGSHKTYLELGYLRLNRDIAAFEDLQDREELRLAGRVAFAKYWSVFGSGVFNLTDRNEDPSFTSDGFEPLRTRLGVAYNDECLEMSFTYRRDFVSTGDARKGNSFIVRLALKNLGFR